MAKHLGDFALGTTIYGKFCTVGTTGAPTQLAGSPVVSVYENDDNTQITAGVTLNVDEDGITGLNQLVIVASSGNGYEVGKFYEAIITTGTVGGTNVAGYDPISFTIEATSALRPTTAARTLDVSAGGNAGIDWANVESPTTALNLSGTNIDTDQVVASVSGAVGSVTGSVGSVAANGITAASIATDAIDADAIADNAINAAAIATGAITAAKFAAGAIDAAAIAANAIDADALAADAVAEIQSGLATAAALTNVDEDVAAVAAMIAALNNLSAAQVNTEMLDVLATDTFAEPSAVPAATASLKDKIGWLMALARNKVMQTATTQTLRNDADSGTIATATVADDGTTFTRGEFA